MSYSVTKDILQPTTLQEAINIIKFLHTSHRLEIERLKEAYAKQVEVIKKLECNRKKELEFLSTELQKYEANLAARTETVAKQIAQKDMIIQTQADEIKELQRKLKERDFSINIPAIVIESNSDSGFGIDNDDIITKNEEIKPETKATRKGSRRFGDTISFLRRVDFSPMKYKPCNRETKKKDEKKNKLDVPVPSKICLDRQFSSDKSCSDDERPTSEETVLSDSGIDTAIILPNKGNDSMNNHFSDDGSEDTSEEIFDRVMTRSSVRRSVKANPKYKKINRSKSKLLEQVKINIFD